MIAVLALTAAAGVGLAAWPMRPPPRRVRMTLAASSTRRGRSSWARRAGRAALLVTAAVVWSPAVVVLILWSCVRPRVRAWQVTRRHRRAVVEGLPDTVDLLAMAVASGQTVALAVDTLARVAAPPFGAAFALVVRRAGRGEPLADALGELIGVLGEPVRPLSAALVASERYGTSLATTLEALSLEARRERRRQAEVAARKLPIRLSFPLVCCILPAFALLTVVPLLAGALASLHA